MSEVPASMLVEGVFSISGRGTVITGPVTDWFHAGDTVVHGDKSFVVSGVEQFAVPHDHPANRPPRPCGLILRGAKPEDIEVGQVWVRLEEPE